MMLIPHICSQPTGFNPDTAGTKQPFHRSIIGYDTKKLTTINAATAPIADANTFSILLLLVNSLCIALYSQKTKMSTKVLLNINMIYYDTDTCACHGQQLELSAVDNVAIFHVPYPCDQEFEHKITQAVDQYDHIIVLCSELHTNSAEFIKRNQQPNIHYFICGVVQGINSYPWMDWFATTTDAYRNNNLLEQLNPYTTKSKYFDVLLGWAKPHRQIAYDYLKDNNKVVLSYLQDRTLLLTDSSWISPENCSIPTNTKNTITKINHFGQEISISQIIPFNIYNQTAYTVVAETNYANDYSFYTEKIVKPILAERLFVVFSGQHYLKNLRALGFKTFDGIIDENYDDDPDMISRYSKVYEQIEYLIAQPQEKILKQIRSITAHNKQLMLNTNWVELAHANIRKIISDQNKR